jgi:hypothetical protein
MSHFCKNHKRRKNMKNNRLIPSLCILILAMLACNMPQSSPTSTPTTTAPNGAITGTVWHDLCAVPEGPAPNPLPAGCVTGSGGGLIANGILEAGEPGIAGISVTLHNVSCADPVIATATTDGNGQYTFSGLSPATYCISVDSNTSTNSLILLPGSWTSPVSAGTLAQLNGNLTEGTGLSNQNFGWDYQFLPLSASTPVVSTVVVSTVPAGGPAFIVDTPANCRKGPGTSFAVVTSFPAGTTLSIQGRNTASTWWLVLVDASTTCWISSSTGHTSGNTGGVTVIADPPTPTPVPGDNTQPALTGPISIYTDMYYPTTNCGANVFNVAIRAADDHLDSVWLSYRFVSSGYTGQWNELTPNDNASGGLYGFNYNLSPQAAGELGGDDGEIQYQFFASDKAGNEASYPPGSHLSLPLQYCP